MAQKSPGMVKQKKIRCNSNWSAQDIIKQLNGDPVKKKCITMQFNFLRIYWNTRQI